VSEQRQRFLEDVKLSYYTVTELADRFGVSRKTAYKWIRRYERHGEQGFHELSRRPHHCPRQTDPAIVEQLVALREKHPHWGARKLLALMRRKDPKQRLPAESTVSRILAREGLVKPRRRHRRAHPGCPKSQPQGPNDICLHLWRRHKWAADYKGQFRLKNGNYCFPLTVSDLSSRYLLGCDAHPAISLEKSFAHFKGLFATYGLPQRIRTDNRVPFASNALARLSQLSVWFIKLGIYPELIEPGKPQQNGVHERMHRTLKQEATIPPASSLRGQQRKLDRFREEFPVPGRCNRERPHEALAMKRPADVYRPSKQTLPRRIERYDYPGHYLVRRVSRSGTIRVRRKQIFVSNTLKEDHVGLEEVDDGVYDLYFCFYQIGRYDWGQNKIRGVISKVGLSRKQLVRASRV